MAVSGTITPLESVYSFKWKIPQFLQRIESAEAMINITSPPFPVCDLENKQGECTLLIQILKASKYVGNVLQNECSSNLTMSYSAGLQKKNGKIIRLKALSRHEYPCSGKAESSWGIKSFISIDVLKKDRKKLLPGGELTVVLELTKPEPKSPTLCLSNHIEGLFQDTEFSDIKILCQDEIFHCHRNLLSVRSPVLKIMCGQGFKEGASGEIKLDSMQPEIVKVCMVLFIVLLST